MSPGGGPGEAAAVYLDYAATTPVDPRVLDAMLPFLERDFGNPSSLCSFGRRARAALEESRERSAFAIGAATPSELAFTGCGTESDVAAVLGIARGAAAQGRGDHVVVSSYEHHAVLEPAGRLAAAGFEVSLVDPRADGIVRAEDLREVVRDGTVLVSVMHANNELGCVNDVAELAAVAHARGAYFHTDAAQSLGKVPLDVGAAGVDAASFALHKLYGPKGIGGLYVRRSTPFEPLLVGGGQEAGLRSGTPNVAGAAGFAAALTIALDELAAEQERLSALRERIFSAALALGGVTVNGGREVPRVPGIANVTVAGVDGESLLAHLDERGICVSTGAACSSGSRSGSHVLRAIGVEAEGASALRVTCGRLTTEDEVAYFAESLADVVGHLRGGPPA